MLELLDNSLIGIQGSSFQDSANQLEDGMDALMALVPFLHRFIIIKANSVTAAYPR